MRTWYTSDLHFGHQKVAEIRGFATTEAHDQAIYDNWKRRVKPDDTVWVLGDLSLRDHVYALYLLSQLPGRKMLVTGNHDPVHPMHRDAHKALRKGGWLDVFETVTPYAKQRILGQPVLLSHFPYSGDHTDEDRHPQYRLPDLGGWLLHGHTHSHVRKDYLQIHVGLDAWNGCPVDRGKVEELMRLGIDAGCRNLSYWWVNL